MQVSSYVKEAIQEADVYASLELQPSVAEQFEVPGRDDADSFEADLDRSFFNIFNQTCGFYQLKRFAATCGTALLLSFIEDVTEYRMADDAASRVLRCVSKLPRKGGARGYPIRSDGDPYRQREVSPSSIRLCSSTLQSAPHYPFVCGS
jgi:hypothetical protein